MFIDVLLEEMGYFNNGMFIIPDDEQANKELISQQSSKDVVLDDSCEESESEQKSETSSDDGSDSYQ